MKATSFGFLLLLGLVMGACQENQRHISGAEFQAEYELRHGQTMHSSEFVGERDGCVFLLKKTMSTINPEKWSEELLFTEAKSLDPVFMEQLRRDSQSE